MPQNTEETWTVHPHPECADIIVRNGSDAPDDRICSVSHQTDVHMILNAVNSHTDLIDALKRVRPLIDLVGSIKDSKIIEDALIKAGAI